MLNIAKTAPQDMATLALARFDAYPIPCETLFLFPGISAFHLVLGKRVSYLDLSNNSLLWRVYAQAWACVWICFFDEGNAKS